jgi:hypothetical protein
MSPSESNQMDDPQSSISKENSDEPPPRKSDLLKQVGDLQVKEETDSAHCAV